MKDKKHTKQSAGQLGGFATVARHGLDHMREIGNQGVLESAAPVVAAKKGPNPLAVAKIIERAAEWMIEQEEKKGRTQ